jgi:hypothetical protein
MKRILLSFSLALGVFSCDNKGNDIVPSPSSQITLLGKWKVGIQEFVYTDSKNAIIYAGTNPARVPTDYLNISETIMQHTGKTPSDLMYVRTDSIITTSVLVSGSVYNSLTYSIIKLTANDLVLKSYSPTGSGGKYIQKEYFSR